MKNKKTTRPRIVLSNKAFVLKDGKFLLIKRSAQDDVQPNKWELPGGKLDNGQSVSDALEREVLEETGLVVVPLDKVVYSYSKIITEPKKYAGMPYVLLVGKVQWLAGEIRLSEEHTEFAWVTKDEALNYDLTEETRSAITVLGSS